MERGQRGLDYKLVFLIVGIILLVGIIIGVFVYLSKPKPDAVNVQCEIDCNTGSINGYCFAEKQVSKDIKATCKELSENFRFPRAVLQLAYLNA